MIRVIRRDPRADQGGTRYWLNCGWFIDGDDLAHKRHYREHRYSAYEPGAGPTGGAEFRGSASRLADLLGQLSRSIHYEAQIGDVHFHWTPANRDGRIWAHVGRAGGWIPGGEWLSGPAFSAACRVWYEAHVRPRASEPRWS
jgi:hypothetical protein